MIISKILKNNAVYYSLHAEQTVTGTFLDEPGSGIFEEMLTHTTIDRIIDDKEIISPKDLALVLDFHYIKRCQNNIKKKIIQLIQKFKYVILTNISKEIIEEIEVGIFKNHNNVQSNEIFIKFILTNESIEEIELDIERIFIEEFLLRLKKHVEPKIEENGIIHDSSSVYLTSYINIKRFISLDKNFFIYSIYQLAIKIRDHWKIELKSEKHNQQPTLICQNLNSSYITSMLSSLLKLDILILDKIGPINKIYSTLDRKIEESRKYIVVSDLVCLGTEIKIAKSIIEFLGGIYLGNVSIIRVETILKKDKSYLDTECVFYITKDNNKEIGYEIKTALNLGN